MADKDTTNLQSAPKSDMELETTEISERIIDAFKLLGANRHVAELYCFILAKNKCTLDEVRAQFHRKIKNLQKLLDNKWAREIRGHGAPVYEPMPPETLLSDLVRKYELDYNKLSENLNTLRTAEAELKVIQDKGLSNQVFNDPERFYSWEKEKIRNAKKTVLAVTDRWMLVLMRAKDDIQYAVSKGVSVRVLGRIHEPNDNDMSRTLEQRAQSLIEAGADIRILKGKIRIRFLVIDEEQVFFAVRKPGGLHKGTWILSPDFAKNFVEEHEEIWNKAEEPEGKFCYIE